MKVAVIHDWLAPMTGAERVLEQVLRCYPGADVFTAVDYLAPEHRHILHGSRVTTSFIQRLPKSRTRYWDYIPLMPFAFEQFDLEPYDLVISCSHTVAKGVIIHPHQVHVCYLESPMRFAWDLQAMYLRRFRVQRGLKSIAARAVLHWMRLWDVASSARVDAFVAVSSFVARRAEVCYRRECDLVYPPCDVEFYTPGDGVREDFYLAASRLTPFKRLDLIVEAFRGLPDRRLVVIGTGPEEARLRARCTPNIQMLGYQSDEVLRDHMRRARGFLFGAPEDFGLVMTEAQACGTPVIALRRGGAVEIVRGLETDEPTGAFFDEPRPELVRAAVLDLERESSRITAEACRRNAERFSPERFRAGFVERVDAALARFAPERTPRQA
jgi:glycosyltransferase involved in cell wall biosynthesis